MNENLLSKWYFCHPSKQLKSTNSHQQSVSGSTIFGILIILNNVYVPEYIIYKNRN